MKWLTTTYRLRELKCIASNLGQHTSRKFHQLAGNIVIRFYFRSIPSPDEDMHQYLYYRFLVTLKNGDGFLEAEDEYMKSMALHRETLQQQSEREHNLNKLRQLGETLVILSPQYREITRAIDSCDTQIMEAKFGRGITVSDIFDAIPCIQLYYLARIEILGRRLFNDEGDQYQNILDIVEPKPKPLNITCKAIPDFVSHTECGICYEVSTARIQCSHEFCGDCMNTYLTNIKSDHRMKATCPMCRSPIESINTNMESIVHA